MLILRPLLCQDVRLTDQLHPKQIVAWRNAGGDFEIVPAFVCDHMVNSPSQVGGVKPILGDLEPL